MIAAIFRMLDPSAPVPSVDDVRAQLSAAGLAKQKRPEQTHPNVELPGHDFPRTPTAKINKAQLRAWRRDR